MAVEQQSGEGHDPQEPPERRIKRYANRKLYDTTDSRYVTLLDVAEMVRRGERVRIVDHRDGSDLTAVVLAQIVYEEQRGGGRGTREGAVRSLRRFIEESGHRLVDSLREAPVARWVARSEEGSAEAASDEGAEGGVAGEEASAANPGQTDGDRERNGEEAGGSQAGSLLLLAVGQLQQLQGEVRRLQRRIERLEERLRRATRRSVGRGKARSRTQGESEEM